MNWIDVNDRVPESSNIVLCINECNIFIGYLDRHTSPMRWHFFDTGLFDMSCDCAPIIDVTHWCEIPELPGATK